VTVVASTFRMVAFHVRQLASTSFFVQLAITAPISFVLLRTLGSLGAGTEVPRLLWADGAIAGCWATTTTAVGLIGYQRFQGTLPHLVFTRLPLDSVFGALTTAAALLGLIGLPISIALHLMLSGSISVTAPAAIGFGMAVLACIVSAGVLSSLFVLSRRALAFEPITLMPIWLLAGLVVPLTDLPVWLQPIALIHPLTSAVELTRQSDLGTSVPWILGSVAVDTLWVLASMLCLRLAARRALIDGTLDLA
jgi:ABC-2 type transport system permease protein